MKKITLPDRATKLQIAILLLNAQSAMARAMTPSEENAKWNASHSGKDELLKEVKLYNLSIDEQGNEADPYRFNAVINSYCIRIMEHFNFSDETTRSMQKESCGFFAEWLDVLDESEIPAAMAKAKSMFRRLLPALISSQQECKSFFRIEYTKKLHDPIQKLRLRDEEFLQCENLLAALWAGVGDTYDEEEALDKAIQKRISVLKSETEKQQASLKYGHLVFHALCEQFGISIASEMTREERNAIQMAIRDGILIRKGTYYCKS